jgi:hypothetical protein
MSSDSQAGERPEMGEAIAEARRYIDRALGGLSTLHLGPLDYNIATTADDLRAAASVLEQIGRPA